MTNYKDLRDNRGKLLGMVRSRSDGRHELRDAQGRAKGIYDQNRDETRDKNGRLVGHGNLLTMLL